MVLFDEEKFRHVILNLVHNAINYSDHGSVTIQGTSEDNGYRVDVRDQGIGIDPSEQETIFKRFYRLDEARNRDSGGTGLGLSIVKNVVLKHQGSIKLTSDKGQGSTFSVTLPKSL
jgi:two-component system sensor histidine kinase SenX3